MLLEVFGQVFISVATTFGYLLYYLNSKYITLLVFNTQWSDVGGYMFGKIYGKTKFARSISPKKTTQGVAGAIFLPTFMNGVLWLLSYCTDGRWALPLPFVEYMCLGVFCAFLSILGDLIESFLKRCANQKDSGIALSDHGGFLDRLDSMLLVFPFLYWYAINFHPEYHIKNYDFDNVNLWAFLHF
jgi:phosphatidate cytidylyltransferase